MKKSYNEKMFSIIIPHYNSSETLLRLMKSIPRRNDLEIIVIDDKSSSEHIEKIKKNKEIKDIIFLENITDKKGAGTCRNIGIENSKGKWLIFADSDDFFVENFNDILDKYLFNTEDIIYFKTRSCYSDDIYKQATRNIVFNRLLNNYLENEKNEESKLDDIRYRFVVPWSKMFKTDFVRKNRLEYDEVIASNDVMFSIKSGYYAKKIKISKEYIYCVTVNKGSLTKNLSEKIFQARFETSKKHNEFLKRIGKESYCTTGLGYLLLSRKYGVKKIIHVLPFVIKNLKYLKYTIKNWPKVVKGKLREKRDKDYFINH